MQRHSKSGKAVQWLQPMRAVLLAAVGAVTLAACTVGPDFHSPAQAVASAYQVPVPNNPTKASAGAAGAVQSFVVGKPIAADWYTLFGSDQLNALILRALANNPTLQASQASLRQAAFQLKVIAGSSWPDVDVGAGVSRNRGNGARIGLDIPQVNGNIFNLYQGSVALSYDLDLFGATARATEAQQARVAFQRDQLRASMLTLIDNVVVTVIHVAAMRDHLAALQNIIAAEQTQADLLDKQAEVGSVAYADVLRARAQLAQTRAQLPGLQHRMAVTRHALAQLVGADPGRFQVSTFSLSDFTLPTSLPVSLSSRLVRQRPDILAAEQMMRAANATIGVAIAHLYPDISLTASLGTATNVLGDIFAAPARIWSIGGSLLAPVFHGGSLRAGVKVARAAWQASYARYKTTVLNAFTQVADVLDAIQRDAATLKARNQALQAVKQSLALVRKQYRYGATDYINVLAAERLYNIAVAAHIKAASQRFVDTASLYHALGGGWWHTPGADPQTSNTLALDNAQRGS